MKPSDYEKQLIEEEIKGCFDFFWNESNAVSDSKGYGLTLDITEKATASIAAVGFALAAYVIGTERGYVKFEEGKDRCLKTLQTIRDVIDHTNGFMVHFVEQSTGENKKSEYSTIDTAILLMGAVTAGEYFKGEVQEVAHHLTERTNWEWLVRNQGGPKIFAMAYSKEVYKDTDGWSKASWDHYAEQLMMYILYAGQDNCNEKLANELYFGFNRNVGSYKGNNLVYCYGNALFVHQFTHCFFDFSQYLDKRGFDWFQNSVSATLANRQFCIDQKWFKTYNENSWGLTAFQGEKGYRVFGAPPFGFAGKHFEMNIDGSVAPYAALSSMVFTPQESLEALKYFASLEKLKGKYGFTDSYNLEGHDYFSTRYLGIDKGPTIIMLDNYLHQTVWHYFMQSAVCQKAIKVLGFQTKDSLYCDFIRKNL